MAQKSRIHFFPKKRTGKLSVWLAFLGFILIYVQYWIAMALNISIRPFIGLIPLALMLVFGITSTVTILKNKDYAISLFIAALIGLLGLISILGEFLLPH